MWSVSAICKRQVLYSEKELGKPKSNMCRWTAFPHSTARQLPQPYPTRLTEENAQEIISQYDIVVDGCDNFPTRYLINDICAKTGKVYVYGAIWRLRRPGICFPLRRREKDYRDLYPDEEEMKTNAPCLPRGVMGITPAVSREHRGSKNLKIIYGFGEVLSGKLWTIDLRTLQSNKFSL